MIGLKADILSVHRHLTPGGQTSFLGVGGGGCQSRVSKSIPANRGTDCARQYSSERDKACAFANVAESSAATLMCSVSTSGRGIIGATDNSCTEYFFLFRLQKA